MLSNSDRTMDNLKVSNELVPLQLFYKPNSVMALDCHYTAKKSSDKTIVFVNGTAKARIVKTKNQVTRH